MSTYVDHHAFGCREDERVPRLLHSWRDHTRQNLLWHYDPARVAAIMAGADPKTQADVARWESLGRRSAA